MIQAQVISGKLDGAIFRMVLPYTTVYVKERLSEDRCHFDYRFVPFDDATHLKLDHIDDQSGNYIYLPISSNVSPTAS